MSSWNQYILLNIPVLQMDKSSAPAILVTSIMFLIGLMTLLLVYILIVLFFKNKKQALDKRWIRIVNLVIQNIIFHEEDGELRISAGVKKLLLIKDFRSLLIAELVKARRNFTGVAGKNLETFFVGYHLDKDSLKKLKSSYWHIKAQGIQELAIMDQKTAFSLVYPLTNHKHEQVRIEAQNAVVVFSGFEGLKFLDFLQFPISQWQQIKLITELGNVNDVPSGAISRWLSAANHSVIIFSLKLVAKYQLYELHKKVIQTLSHTNPAIRLQAVLTLKEIYTGETAKYLLLNYPEEELPNKLAILDALGSIGTDEDIAFLLEQFLEENHQLKLAAGRAITSILNHFEPLENCHAATQYPWSVILKQIKGESAA